MTMYSSNDFRNGLKIILNDEPYSIEKSEFVNPGKGQAFTRVRMRRLLTGKLIEKTFKSTDSVEGADVLDISMTYIYNYDKFWYFMNYKTFEQLAADSKIVGDNAKWLLYQAECIITLWNNNPIAVVPPNFIELEVIDTNPGLKGDTVSTSNKIAILSTGAKVKVPLFIQIGEIIKVDTRIGEYISRIK